MHRHPVSHRASRARAVRAAAASVVETLEGRRLLAADLVAELYPATPEAGARVGEVLAARGEYVLVGDQWADTTVDDTTVSDVGRALLFKATGGAPIVIENPDAQEFDSFGLAVAFIDDDTFAITAINSDFTGTIYLYDIVNGTPTPAAVPVISGGGSGAIFGQTLGSVGGDLLVADTQGNGSSGVVYRYDLDGTLDDTVPTYSLGGADDSFGQRIAVNEVDGHILVTARGANFTPVAVEFDATGGIANTYTVAEASGFQDFGGLAFHGGTVLIGDTTRDRVIEFSRSDASVVRTINGSAGTWFGDQIAISGDALLIGAKFEAGQGAVHVYDATSTTDEPAAAFSITPGAAGGEFGAQIGVLGNGHVVIGDPGEDVGGAPDAGGAHVFNVTLDAGGGNATPTAALDAQGNLVVTGTAADELIVVKGDGAGGVVVLVDGQPLGGSFAVTGTVIINGGDGNDAITSDKTNPFATEIHGGAGSDTITGGGGNDVMFGDAGDDSITANQGSDVAVGGEGNDILYGGTGRDVLIGGIGSDTLAGDNGEDILVAGSSIYDDGQADDAAALASILAIWTSGDAYDVRVSSLSNDLLSTSSVFDDVEADELSGGNGQDWFVLVGGQDTLNGTKSSETVS